MKNFYDEQHARNYLLHSVIRLKSLPIMVQDIQQMEKEKFRIVYSLLGKRDHKISFFPDKDFNLKPVPLGMMNTQHGTYYVQRNPARGWKIGLCRDNVYFHTINNSDEIKARSLLDSLYMTDCVMGYHPSYKTALKAVISGKCAVQSFSRKFAINGGSLFYKTIGEAVGICERDKPVLFNDFQFLKEVLEEDTKL